jgi:hypothetical protein
MSYEIVEIPAQVRLAARRSLKWPEFREAVLAAVAIIGENKAVRILDKAPRLRALNASVPRYLRVTHRWHFRTRPDGLYIWAEPRIADLVATVEPQDAQDGPPARQDAPGCVEGQPVAQEVAK